MKFMKSLAPLITASLKVLFFIAILYQSYKGLQAFEDTRLTATTIVALSGTLTGFLITATSMMISSADRAFIINLRQTGHFETLIKDLTESATMWVITIITALSCHIFKDHLITLSVAISLMIFSLIHFLLTMKKFRLVILQLSKL